MRIRKSLLLAAVVCATVVTGALASTAAAGTAYGACGTPPGVPCKVVYLQSRGISNATAYASGGLTDSKRQTCLSATCTKAAIAYPSPNVTVSFWIVDGPNVVVICSGPTWLC